MLYPKGLQDPWCETDLNLCSSCRSALVSNSLRQPQVSSLANFQYYGYERLPLSIRGAFSEVSEASAQDLVFGFSTSRVPDYSS
ncbi:hypothetical protein EV424DRAFT_208120 [Suillus variegatus]|nr:hypothetical protein EV424DRAFT_208120 [Suillus variegatus]